MSDEKSASGKKPPADIDPEMRRGVSRRGLLTGELRQAGLSMAKQLPGFGSMLGMAYKESAAQRDARLVTNLWQLLMGREPKADENSAGMEVVRNAQNADEKGDALVDILWALCRTQEFEDLNRSNSVLVRGLYRIALDRDPTPEEKEAALTVMADAEDAAQLSCEDDDDHGVPHVEPEEAAAAARRGALEGLFMGLIHRHDSVLRRDPLPGPGMMRRR